MSSELIDRATIRRPILIEFGNAFVKAALAHLRHGCRIGQPHFARRAGGLLVQATAIFQEAGMGRKAAAVSRLAERCRRHWELFEAREGCR